MQSFNFNTACTQRLSQNMDKLHQFALDHQLYFFDGIVQRVARAHQKSEQHLYSMVSKTETLLDIIEDRNIKLVLSEFDLNQPNFIERPFISSTYIKFNLPEAKHIDISSFDQVVQDIDMNNFKFEGNIDLENKCIHVNFSNIKNDCEIACYLYQDGLKIDQIWYQSEHYLVFKVPNLDTKKRYRLTAFYKWKKEGIAQKTESLTLN